MAFVCVVRIVRIVRIIVSAVIVTCCCVLALLWPMMHEMTSIGTGKMMVELFSAEMLFRVCRYRSWSAAGLSATTSAACLRALLALCSPSAAITWPFSVQDSRIICG